MLRSALLTLLALMLAIVGGSASVWLALDARETVGAVTENGWVTVPDRGSPGSDPYSRARLARDGALALGHAEGVTFTAERDSDGRELRRECRYTLSGPLPASRLWTLHATDAGLAPIPDRSGRAGALNSFEALFAPEGTVAVSISAQPAAGNWLAISGTGVMMLVLTFYDTPLSGDADLTGVNLPTIAAGLCDA